jgi:hypothetical protein
LGEGNDELEVASHDSLIFAESGNDSLYMHKNIVSTRCNTNVIAFTANKHMVLTYKNCIVISFVATNGPFKLYLNQLVLLMHWNLA